MVKDNSYTEHQSLHVTTVHTQGTETCFELDPDDNFDMKVILL